MIKQTATAARFILSSKARKRSIVDASIVVLAAVVLYSLWAGWSADKPSEAAAEIKPGQLFDVPEGLGSKPVQLAVVAALSTTCPACQESVAFYSELATSCRKNDVPFITLFDQPEHRARGWLSLGAIQAQRVYSRRLSSLGFSRVPTLLLLDAESKVSGLYQGGLSFLEEARILRSSSQAKTWRPATATPRPACLP